MNHIQVIIYFTLFMGFTLASLSFYEAYRVQKNRGILFESKLSFIIMLIASISQPLLTKPSFIEQEDFMVFYGMFLLAIIIILVIRIYFSGRRLTVYETTKNSTIEIVRTELNNLSIEHEEKNDVESDQYIFHLINEKAKINISWWNEPEGVKTFTIIFKKWWRILDYEALQENISKTYKRERINKIFKKQIITQVLLGIGILCFFSFYIVRLLNKV